MHSALIVGISVAVAVLASLLLTRVSDIPYPVFLVVIGLVIGFLPGVPSVSLDPKVFFYGFLPPLVYQAAFLIAPRELRANWLPIALLAFGLVLATMFGVALLSWVAIAAIGIGPAFVLGAVVSPTDPVAATAVMRRLGAPLRVAVIVEAEGLINDGIGLVLFTLAVSSVTGSSVSVGSGTLKFLEVAIGGTAIGLVVGWLAAQIRRRVSDTETEIVLSLLTPFVAYIPADYAGLSGVLATVAAGVYLGAQSEGIFQPGVRIQAFTFWEVLVFLLESVLFVFLGLQFPVVIDHVQHISVPDLAYDAALVSAVAIVVRLAWLYVVPSVVGRLRRRWRPTSPLEPWQHRTVMGWCGMRGALSLAAAFAIPLRAHGHPFPGRDLVLFLTFSVIIATLVLQGTTLPTLIRVLHLGGTRRGGGDDEVDARRALAEAAIARADALVNESHADAELVMTLRETYEQERRGLARDDAQPEQRPSLADYRRIRRELLAAQRSELNRRSDAGLIGSDALRRLRRELDLEESMLAE